MAEIANLDEGNLTSISEEDLTTDFSHTTMIGSARESGELFIIDDGINFRCQSLNACSSLICNNVMLLALQN